MAVGLDHPEGKAKLNEANSPSKQAIPGRVGMRNNTQELQALDGDLNQRTCKSHKNRPEEPAPMMEYPVHQDAEKDRQRPQKQENRPRVTLG